ncbi:hypothetical protein WA577_001485 [Blastocystis sp. JDR]
MAERVEAEILHMKEKREAYSAAVDTCETALKASVDGYYAKVYDSLAQNAKAIENENNMLVHLNKQVNSEVEGFQAKVDTYDRKLTSFQDSASSLDYFDKWAKNIKSKMYEVR